MRVGIVGLGNMGGRIAKRLLDQEVEVGVYDLSQHAMDQFQKLGAKPCSSPYELASAYPYVLTVLPNVHIVKETLLGDQGLIGGMTEESLLIEMTTSEPTITEQLNETLVSNDLRMIDAPVSGGVKKAEDGTLAIMVGGKEEHFNEALPLLNKIGKSVVHVGEVGAGHTIKALNNLISATTLAATGEALAVGVKRGLDPNKMLDVINSSTGRSFSSEFKFPKQVLTREFEVGFTLDLMVKDLKIALSLAEEEEVPMLISESSYELWEQAWSSGRGDQDHTAVVQHIESMFNTEIKG